MEVLLISLGCDKNLVDSEVILGMLVENGYTITDDEEAADIIIINTCCFIHDAKEESIETILDMAALKADGRLKALIVTGCLAERYREEIQKEIPEVDAIVGTAAIDDIIAAIDGALVKQCGMYFSDLNTKPVGNRRRLVTTGGHYAYLKIAEGCDKHCTYCIIPRIRGPFRSIDMEELVAEARKLVSGGVRELILVAQETTLYGVDRYGRKALPELLTRLCAIDGLVWVRLLYCYPEEITDELIAVMAREPKICHYLDLPIQHGSDTVLKRMGRRTDNAQIRDLVGRLRHAIPDICLRTTMITGFPGESVKEHEESLKLAAELQFDRLGVFTYSCEEDTPAAALPGQIREKVKRARRSELMRQQQRTIDRSSQTMIGRELMVMVEGSVSGEDAYVARTYRDTPNVDGYLFFDTTRTLMSGDFVKVRVTNISGYDLIGELCDESAE
ncbi:MAG: 30S ribosomal protein S12 methylthiotransferase RimO [Lachnospiraceae bacterium]|jgi:ribosomal protein S12 methylthiotransferase|nr:30S ribosomal protein S12 methylthiotransferase RimO [Lachnospiraceae bacterium]